MHGTSCAPRATQRDIGGQAIAVPHKWTFYFLMAVGFWNFVGAGMFGFLINMPIVSYFEVGTLLTRNHGHAAMMGVFGMLAIALMVFVLRQMHDRRAVAAGREVFEGRVLGAQHRSRDDGGPEPVPRRRAAAVDVIENGYWHARSLDYITASARCCSNGCACPATWCSSSSARCRC